MKNHSLPVLYCLLSVFFFSCVSLEPVTIGAIENVRVKNLSREGIEVDFGVKIKNPNKIAVTVFPSEFDATVNGIDMGKIKLHKRVRIKAYSDTISEFHVKSDFSKLGLIGMANILPMLSSKKADILLKGNLRVGKWYYKRTFPVEFKRTISLSQ